MTRAELLVHLSRWIYASSEKHFVNKIPQDRLPLFPEMYSKSEEERKLRNFCEFRLDGPRVRQRSPRYTEAYFEINILIQSTMRDSNFHIPQVDIGLVVPAFTSIPIYKYGQGSADDGSLLSCATITPQGRQEEIIVSQFGEIDPQLKLFQATVETSYLLKIKHNRNGELAWQ